MRTLFIIIFVSLAVVFYFNELFKRKRERRLQENREKKDQQFQDLMEKIKDKS